MTQEIINKANELQNDIDRYETVIRYAATNLLRFNGEIGISDVSNDKELAELIYKHCKNKQRKLIEEFDKL